MFGFRCRRRLFFSVVPILFISTLVGVAAAQDSFIGSHGASLWAGYNYHSYSFNGGIKFNELRLGYSHPLPISRETSTVTPFAYAYLTDLKISPKAFGLAQDFLRFGGSWRTALAPGTIIGVRGEYDYTKRQEKWYSGGQGAVDLLQFIGYGIGSLRLTYYTESTADNLIFQNSPSGYEVAAGYSQRVTAFGSRAMVIASAYNLDVGTPDKQKGWSLAASISSPRYWFLLRGKIGNDSILGSNSSVGSFVTVEF